MKVLIVDDDRMLVHALSHRLRKAGWEVAVAFDGMQAGMMVQRDPPSAVVLDIGLPGGSGLEVLKRLRTSVKSNTIPVVVVSAHADPKIRETAIGLGADAVLAKPVDFEQLHALLGGLTGQPAPAGTHAQELVSAAELAPDGAPATPPLASTAATGGAAPEPAGLRVPPPVRQPAAAWGRTHPAVPPVVAVPGRSSPPPRNTTR